MMADYTPSTILNFTESYEPSSLLDFGRDGAVDAPTVNAVIAATVVVTASGTGTARKPSVGLSADIIYDLNAQASGAISYSANVFRGAICDRQGGIESSRLASNTASGSYDGAVPLFVDSKAGFESSKLVADRLTAVFESNKNITAIIGINAEQGRLIGTGKCGLNETVSLIGCSRVVTTETARLVSRSKSLGAEVMRFLAMRQQYAIETARAIGGSWSSYVETARFDASSRLSQLEASKIPPWVAPYVVIVDDDYYQGTTILNFECPWFAPNALLNFGVGCQYQVDPDDKPIFSDGVIFVINDLLLTRIDSGDEIKMLGFNVGIDNSSYCWTFSANVPFTELSKVDITNELEIEVELLVNGQAWRFILDACDDNTQFNSSSLSIKGKSRASRLAYPFAQHRGYKYTAPMTARQIANDELNRASIPSGFTLDWQLVSELGWDVPANTYSYSNRTPINSLQWIAEAAGGFINSHPSDDIIRVLSNYPIPSWEWAEQAPSIIIPEQLITSRSRKRVQKSRYNGVMVSGEREGSISALVKRNGTSGGYTPNQVVSDLIADAAVARHRGQCVLSDTGDIGNIGLSLPMHSAIGLLTPSTLIRVNDGGSWVGMVRGTSISGRLGSNQSLQIEQSIDVERHFDKEFV